MNDVVVSWEEFLGAQRYGAVQQVHVDCGSNQVLRFPEELSTSDYVKLRPDFSRVKRAVSVCSWIQKSTLRENHWTAWFSYAMSHETNEFVLGDWVHILEDRNRINWKDVITVKNQWYHYCFTWSQSTKMMDFFLNGTLVKSHMASSSIAIGTGGILVLGQDQDSYGGRFDKRQAFGGDMQQLNVFSRKLSVQEVATMYFDGRCSPLPSILMNDVVVSWEEFLGAQRYGAVQQVHAECGCGQNLTGMTTQQLA